MFETTSLSFRAVIASLLGSCFGVALILFTHPAQAQTMAAGADAPAVAMAADKRLVRLGEVALQALRGAEPLVALGGAGTLAMRLDNGRSEPGSGLRWQVTRMPWLRSEGDIPRSRDLVSVGVQVRF